MSYRWLGIRCSKHCLLNLFPVIGWYYVRKEMYIDRYYSTNNKDVTIIRISIAAWRNINTKTNVFNIFIIFAKKHNLAHIQFLSVVYGEASLMREETIF